MSTRPDWVDDRLFPFDSRFVDVRGHEVHYVDEGEGPTLLFLHGNPTWSFLYRGVIERLRDTHRCVALDYPGFGLSRPGWNYDGSPGSHADVVETFVLERDLREVALVAHDWGGPIGFAVAGRHPERFRGFVLGNTWAWPIGSDRLVAAFSRVAGAAVARSLNRRTNAFVNLAIPLASSDRPDRDVMRHYRRPFTDAERRRFVARLPGDLVGAGELQQEAARALVMLSDRPALIVWGAQDPVFRSRVRRRFENAFPDHTTWVLEDASHYVYEDAPRDVAAAISEWSAARH